MYRPATTFPRTTLTWEDDNLGWAVQPGNREVEQSPPDSSRKSSRRSARVEPWIEAWVEADRSTGGPERLGYGPRCSKGQCLSNTEGQCLSNVRGCRDCARDCACPNFYKLLKLLGNPRQPMFHAGSMPVQNQGQHRDTGSVPVQIAGGTNCEATWGISPPCSLRRS
jgi:hypothetical protein